MTILWMIAHLLWTLIHYFIVAWVFFFYEWAFTSYLAWMTSSFVHDHSYLSQHARLYMTLNGHSYLHHEYPPISHSWSYVALRVVWSFHFYKQLYTFLYRRSLCLILRVMTVIHVHFTIDYRVLTIVHVLCIIICKLWYCTTILVLRTVVPTCLKQIISIVFAWFPHHSRINDHITILTCFQPRIQVFHTLKLVDWSLIFSFI